MTNPLKNELKHFEDIKKDLLKSYKDQFALVKDDKFVGAYTTFQEAFESGVEKFGNEPFLVKQVSEEAVEAYYPALTLGLISAHS